MNTVDRRNFLKTSALGAAGALFTVSVSAAQEEGKTTKKTVLRRTLGKTGLKLPIVSMGVMNSRNAGLVQAALAAGIIHFDTAHGYQEGKNEEMLGEVLKEYPRESFVIASKVQAEGGEGKAAVQRWLAKVDMSLRRLRMEQVDILYLHAIKTRADTLAPAMLEALQLARESGRARFVGVSTHKNEPEVIDAAIESGVYDVVLTSVNFKQDHYAEVKKAIARAAKAGIGIVGMKTMAGGYLDKAKKQPLNCKAALKFVLQDENVCTTIPGITSFEQLAENASVNEDITLSDEEKAGLVSGRLEGGLYCQGCEHCVPGCPRGLPIPDMMRAYMYTYGYRDLALAQSVFHTLEISGNPCDGCGSCTVRCAKGFNVAGRIADVSRVSSIPAEFLS
jgi:predicted aldo/keto reductase-like oxidoreductase